MNITFKPGMDTDEILKRIKKHKKLVFEYNPVKMNPPKIEFDIQHSKEAMTRIESACTAKSR